MIFHWYYVQFHSRVGSAARQLIAFPPIAFRVESMSSSSLARRWSLLQALLSQQSVSSTSVCAHTIWFIFNIHANAVAFFCRVDLKAELFFWTPSARLALWTAARCVSWWLQGHWGGFAGKTGRGQAGALQTHPFLLSTPTALQHRKEKPFPQLIIGSLLFSLG